MFHNKMLLPLAVALGMAATLARAEEITMQGEQRGAINPVDSAVDKNNKKIDANFNGGWRFPNSNPSPEQAELQAHKNRATLNLINNQETAIAGAKNGYAQALAPNSKNSMGSGTLISEGEGNDTVVHGGIVNAGKHRGIMRNQEDGDDQKARFNSGTRQIDTIAENVNEEDGPVSATRFGAEADGKKGLNKWSADPSTQSRLGGDGKINIEQGSKSNAYNYNIETDDNKLSQVSMKDADLTPGQQTLTGRKQFDWICQGEEDGESYCRDGNGKYIGRTKYTSNGDTVVYDKNGKVVGRGTATKISDEEFVVKVNDGLFTVTTKEIKGQDCFANELAKLPAAERDSTYSGAVVNVTNFNITYSSREEGGKTLVKFPDCMKIEFDVRLPAGVSFERLAYHLDMHIMPLGKYDCADAGTCHSNKRCYYCGLCNRIEYTDMGILDNTEGNECKEPISDGVTPFRVSRVICPTPEQEKYVLCNNWDRSLAFNKYYDYSGDVNSRIVFWLKPDNEKALMNQFETQKNNPLFKNLWLIEYKAWIAKGGGNALSGTPSDYELRAWFLEKNMKEQLVGCTEGVIDYNLGGSKTGNNVLLDWFSQVGNDKKLQLFREENCPEVQSLQEEEYNASKGTSTGGGGLLGGLLGGSSGGSTGGSATNWFSRFGGRGRRRR